MKAAANGVLNVSVLDGWWDEGWTGDNGWAIGGRETNPDEGAQDWADAQDLYRILEQELIPAYYERGPGRAAGALDPADAQLHREHDLALLDHPDAPRVRRAPVPAGRRRPAGAAARRHASRRRRARPRSGASRPIAIATPPPEDPAWHPRISLALAIHNHQPVGNFGWVFAEVYERAYLPLLEAARAPPRRPRCRSTTPARCWSGSRRSGRPSWTGSAPSSAAARWSCWAAGCTSRSSPRCPSTTGSPS